MRNRVKSASGGSHIDFHRQLDIVSIEDLNRYPIIVIGAGGIGSPVVLALAKMGCQNLIVYDHDIIESHNLPNQFYRLKDMGKPKVEALKEIVDGFAGCQIEVKKEKFSRQALNGIVIAAVDSMKVRQMIWQRVKYQPQIALYIDGRMGAEEGRIYAVRPCDPEDVGFYEANLYSDKDASQLPCTARAIIYNVLVIAGLVAKQVKSFLRGEKFPKEIIFDLTTLIICQN